MKNKGLNITRHALPALALLCLNLMVSGCASTTEDLPTFAHVGGEIINPITNHLEIRHKGVVLDTVYLNEKNRFSYKIENAQKGLYVIKHKPETQSIFISPGDSLLLRVNTIAFDESLHFSGKGNEQNNFLTSMFLKDEETADLLLSFHEYPPDVFFRKADSIKTERLESLEQISQRKELSEEFVQLAGDVIKNENNDLKERYSYLVNKYYKEYAKQFPENFHDYREEIDFNSESLQCSPGYRRLLENYLVNYSLSWCAQSGLDEADCYSTTDINNVKARIRKAGELVTVPGLKKYLLEKLAVRGIVMAKKKEDIEEIIQELKAQEMASSDLLKMEKLGRIQNSYLPGNSFAKVPLLNMKGELVTIDEVVNKPTVVFLWSIYDEGHQEEHEFISHYQKKYPDIDFIGLNLDPGEEPAWRVAVRQNNYKPQSEYQLGVSRIDPDFYRYFLDKILLLNSSAEVVVGDTYLTSPEFESHLLKILEE